MDDERELEVIRRQMDDTRASLTDKLGALESKVSGTVEDATSAVADTVENVKNVVEGVTDTVQSVTETFSLSRIAERSPWGLLGGSVAAGLVAGWLFAPSRREAGHGEGSGRHRQPDTYAPTDWSGMSQRELSPGASATHAAVGGGSWTGAATGTGSQASAPAASAGAAPQPRGESSWFGATSPQREESSGGGWFGTLGQAVSGLTGLGVGSLLGVVRELVNRSLPGGVAKEWASLVDNFTEQLGAKPIHGEVLPEGGNRGSGESGGSRERSEGSHEKRDEAKVGRPVGAAKR